jgi:DNA primase
VEAAKKTIRSPQGRKALDYLRQERGFSDKIIDQFDFGYCPLNANHDLSGRIITPIYDQYGQLVVVSTRHLNKDHPHRFLHESFDKGSYIYGLCYAKDEIIKKGKAILVEGEFDVASLHTFGLKMAVGVCGSAFTLSQASLLARYCSVVYLVFDGDDSGRKAIRRVLKLHKKNYLDAYKIDYIPVYLPNNTDPDEYIREKGKTSFIHRLVKAKEEYKLGINI